MDKQINAYQRKFRFSGQEFPDPKPTASVQQVQQLLAMTVPAIGTAIPIGPSYEEDHAIYTFTTPVGTKG